MIANIVLGMLIGWFVCVLVITIRASAEQREHDALVARQRQAPQRRSVSEDSLASALVAVDTGARPAEAPEVAPVSLMI